MTEKDKEGEREKRQKIIFSKYFRLKKNEAKIF